MFMGMKPGELEIVYGDTKHRKSIFVQNIAANVANAGHPVLFVGLELIGAQNTERWLKMGYDNLPIVYPADTPTYKDIDALVQVAVEEGIELVVVDHLHMWRGVGENEQAAITDICIEMKRVAMKHKVPLILVSHISGDRTSTGPPSYKRLKGSTSISQLADKVICVYSPGVEYDGPDFTIELSIPLSRRLPNSRSAELTILPSARLT
jgi:replicative DNA helicase